MDLEHEKRLTEVEARSKSNCKRLDDVEKKQDDLSELVGTVKLIADREERVEKDVGEIKTDIKDLKSKPAKRWDTLVDKIIFTAVGIIVGYIFVKIGIGG